MIAGTKRPPVIGQDMLIVTIENPFDHEMLTLGARMPPPVGELFGRLQADVRRQHQRGLPAGAPTTITIADPAYAQALLALVRSGRAPGGLIPWLSSPGRLQTAAVGEGMIRRIDQQAIRWGLAHQGRLVE